MTLANKKKLEEMSLSIRKMALDMAFSAGKRGSHIGGSFSCLEIFTVLYGKILRFDINDPAWGARDRFLASKGHCILTHFSSLAYVGFIDRSILNSFSEDGGCLAGHPMNLDMGLEYSAGSLGMGLSVGIGMAIDAKNKNRTHKVYVLLGDGECQEGSVWEAFMAAPKFALDNLVAIIDNNHLSYDGKTNEIMDLGDLENKLTAFGWKVKAVNGHDLDELTQAMQAYEHGKPYVIIANTVKAHKIPGLEGKPECHHAELTKEMYEKALLELKRA